jgi:hypothetical protein
MDSALIKAIIRWFFTHKKESTFKLMTVLEALGFPIDSPKTLQVSKREIKSRVGELQAFGIDYDPKEEIFHYRGNSAVGFIPSLFNKNNELIESSTKVVKKNIDDIIGEKIQINENIDILTDITYESEGAFICAAVVETKNGNNFRIRNAENLSKEDFEMEVILHLESLLYKE